MRKHFLILLLIFNSLILFGQDIKKDYVVLRPQNNSSKIDTIFGEIIFPKNGIITKAKIIVNNEKMKYAPNKVIGFKSGERYFASVPYNSHGNVFAERVANGKMNLCYYDTNPNGYNGGLAGATATSLTSYYFIKLDTMENYLRVPHSREKARDEISILFKDNERIYNQILSEDFRVWKLPDIVKEYNDKK
ncbi:hypothetical protein [uncultured Sunxiuqinia sp.]|uniref:hypothetical protein n=1 Tax=uncultured Sunxiuqinia sp. TaxID=1573825 RepID=UPI002AA89359|nr:hypothetical protein [uncultured Sunxiuqinia sp.]